MSMMFPSMLLFSDINDCEGDPCVNGGTCTDGVDSYSCMCVAGFTDRNCSTGKKYCIIELTVRLPLKYNAQPRRLTLSISSAFRQLFCRLTTPVEDLGGFANIRIFISKTSTFFL